MNLVVFLGNPGKNYARTRHNFARMLLDRIPGSESLPWREKFHGRIADYRVGADKCRILVPETFMNLSGKSVSAALTFHKTDVEHLLVVHDDLELTFGRIAWRVGGGLSGHNGLKSIRDGIGSAGFSRLRLGIGRPPRGSVQSWVLGRFDPVEEAILPVILDSAARQLDEVLAGRSAVQEHTEPVTVYTPN